MNDVLAFLSCVSYLNGRSISFYISWFITTLTPCYRLTFLGSRLWKVINTREVLGSALEVKHLQKGKERSRSEQKERLSHNAVSIKDSADSKGNLKTEWPSELIKVRTREPELYTCISRSLNVGYSGRCELRERNSSQLRQILKGGW